jgi:hypothetical protein
MKIALVQLALGEFYYQSWDSFHSLTKQNFLPNHDVTIHLFTDAEKVAVRKGVELHKISSRKWPEPTFLKYSCVLQAIKDNDYDYVYYLDSDNVCEAPVPEALAKDDFSIISPTSWGAKYAGAFFGGKTKFVTKFCKLVQKEVDKIFRGEKFPDRENDEELMCKCEVLGCNVTTYPLNDVFCWYIHGNDHSNFWISQAEKDFVKSHGYDMYVDFGFLKGEALINENLKLICVLDYKSYSTYGRLEQIAPKRYRIAWQDPSYGISYLDM